MHRMQIQKECFKCGDEKPLSEFYRHPRMADGYLGKCKSCTKTDTAAAHAVRLASDPEFRFSEAERHRLKSAKARAAGKASKPRPETQREWRRRNPEKVKAHNAVARAVKSGALKRMPCEVCGEAKSQAHHADYNKVLEVRWLCAAHHGGVHIRIRK